MTGAVCCWTPATERRQARARGAGPVPSIKSVARGGQQSPGRPISATAAPTKDDALDYRAQHYNTANEVLTVVRRRQQLGEGAGAQELMPQRKRVHAEMASQRG